MAQVTIYCKLESRTTCEGSVKCTKNRAKYKDTVVIFGFAKRKDATCVAEKLV